MEQLRLEESVRLVLEKCAEQDEPSITRDLLNGLVNSNSQQSLDVLSILLRELWVYTLHRGDSGFHTSFVPAAESDESPTTASPKNANKDTTDKLSESNPSSASKLGEKKSVLGTISLPRATEFEEESLGGPSASDVPSHSSASSEDEENDDVYAEEMWKQALESKEADQSQTHKDFFASLVKDVEEGEAATEEDEADYEDDLSLDERIFVAISSSLALAEQTQFERNIQDGEEDSEIILTSMMISEIAMNIAQQIGLDNEQAVRCAEDIEDCLCFLYGQPLDSDNRNFLTQTIQKLLLDRADTLIGGQWFDPTEEDDDDATFDPLESINELASPHDATPEKNSPTQGRMASYIVEEEDTSAQKKAKSMIIDDSSSSSSDEKVVVAEVKEEKHVKIAPSSNHVHQTPARTPARSMVTPGLSTNSKRTRINYNQLDPDLPAWMIPKSPLDSIFRTGYGGIGQSQLAEVIALVEDEECSDDEDEDEHQRLHETSMDQVSLAEEEREEGESDEEDIDAIQIDDIPTDFGRELLQQSLPQHQQHIVPRNVMTKRHPQDDHFDLYHKNELIEEDEVPRPEDFPSTSFANGSEHLTSNPSLNAMMYESFKGYLSQIASESKNSLAHNSTDFPYDYDEATVGTSMDSEGYKRMMKLNRGRLSKSVKSSGTSPKQSPKKSPANSPKPKHGAVSSSNPNSPHAHQKPKQPITKAIVQSKKNPVIVEDDGIEEIHKTDDNLMLESPNNSFTLPKKSIKEPGVKIKKKKVIKKKVATSAAKTLSTDGGITATLPASTTAVATKKKKTTKTSKSTTTSTPASRLLEATEASKIRGDTKVNALLASKRWN